MDTKDLPRSIFLVSSSNWYEIANALIHVFGSIGCSFTHIDIIQGEPFSGRILYKQRVPNIVSLPRPFSSLEMARELIRFGKEEARYDPLFVQNRSKGWEIRKVYINNLPAAIALAKWV